MTLNIMRQRPGITDRWELNKKVTQFTAESYGMAEGSLVGFLS